MKNSEYITVATKAKAPQSKVDRYKWTKADAPGEDAVRRAQLFHDKGGELVYAQAIIGEVNKGLRKKYEIRTRAAE